MTRRSLFAHAAVVMALTFGVLANTSVGLAAGAFINCNEACGPEAECEESCLAVVDDLPSFYTTCGEYGGPPWNGVGQCLGTCGDGYCNEYNEEEYGTCGADCGECGDDFCDPLHEVYGVCTYDCGSCGDGKCYYAFESQCSVDCGTVTNEGEECDFEEQDCDPGQVCNNASYCLYPSNLCSSFGTWCHDNNDCCETELCFQLPPDMVNSISPDPLNLTGYCATDGPPDPSPMCRQ